MNQNIRLYQETQDKANLIHDLTQEAYAQWRSFLPDSGVWQETPESLISEFQQGVAFFCAVHNEEIVGAVRCQSLFSQEQGNFMLLRRLAVLPTARNLGVGTALIKAVEDHACQLGFGSIFLQVHLAKPQLQTYYTGLGYTPCNRIQGLPDIGTDLYWMTKLINLVPLTQALSAAMPKVEAVGAK